MGSMDAYHRWPIPGSFYGEYPYGGFGGIYPGNTQQQMNQYAGLWQNQGMTPSWPAGLQGMQQIEMWKCDHCGSRFEEKPERCKNCGSNAILRFDDPGEGARQSLQLQQQLTQMEMTLLFGLGMEPKQKSVSEAVAEFREEVAAITYRPSLWQRFLRWLDRCGYRGR